MEISKSRSSLIDGDLGLRRGIFSKYLSSKLKDIEVDIEEYMKLDDAMKVVEFVLPSVKEEFKTAYITAYLFTSSIDITVTEGIPDIITKIAKGLGRSGFRQQKEPEDFSDGKGKYYYYHRIVSLMGGDRTEEIRITCYWRGQATDSGECQLFKVRTDVIEKPVYEMICTDDPRFKELIEVKEKESKEEEN